jgi:histidine triad (HIT) family protein
LIDNHSKQKYNREFRMSDCIFCKIIDGHIPSRKVYEDDRVVAFWDAHPASPIHILIVPKNHIPTLNDIPENDQILAHVGAVAKTVARQFGVDQSGYRLFVNVNRGGGQMVFHLHAHLVAGNDLGTLFIKAAIACAILWRKLMGLVVKNRVSR